MSVSTDAILIYGYTLPDYDEEALEDLPFMDGFDDFDDLITHITKSAHLDYSGRRAAVEAFPIELVTHCHGEYPNYVLGVRSTKMRAHRGYPVEFAKLPEPSLEDISRLKSFMIEHRIPFEGAPKWVLCSMWW